jgi:hypothetical protein
MTTNGKIIGMIAIGVILMVFLGAIVGVINRDSKVITVNPVVKNTLPAKNNDSKAVSAEEVKLPQASGNINMAADAILLETKGEQNDIASEISESEDVFGSQEISDLAETYAESDF